jgi:hypothetical protein
MAPKTTRLGTIIGVVTAIAVAVFGPLIVEWYRARPHLALAGEPDVYEDRTEIQLRTASSVPMIVNSVWYRITDVLECCAIEDEEPIQIDTTCKPLNKWHPYNITNFNVEPGKVMSVPIQLYDADPAELIIDLVIRYGDGEGQHDLGITGVHVIQNSLNP